MLTPIVVAMIPYAFFGLDVLGDEIEINLRESLGETDLPAPVSPVDGVLL